MMRKVALLAGLAWPALAAAQTAPVDARDGFDTLMTGSMERMHAGMAVPPSGDPDRDFAIMMIPHHQGAIDMAKAQLLYGRDPGLRRLAQGILVEQQAEIAVLERYLADRPASTSSSGGTVGHGHHEAPIGGHR